MSERLSSSEAAKATNLVQDSDWVRDRIRDGVKILALASRYAELGGADIEQFAIRLDNLSERGCTECDLHWLMSQALVEHLIERTLPGDTSRSFRDGGVAICGDSCFVLTEAGYLYAQHLDVQSLPVQLVNGKTPEPLSNSWNGKSHNPEWDADRQELWFLGKLVKRYRLPSPNQAAILSAFEEESWPARIDDPLPMRPEQDPKRRLHDTIRNLNRAQLQPLIRFAGDGSGQGVLWENVAR